jgi:YidC/Oxa1 family membrane protein insertase
LSIGPLLGSTLGHTFAPIFEALAWLIAIFYALIPNYAIAIALLTVVVMIVTAPLTVKSTRSMVAMQRLAPEMKKLQAKYKGDKQTLNDEMMKLYREHGVNPAGGCLPMLIQFPIFFILYAVVRGLTYTVKTGHYYRDTSGVLTLCHHGPCSSPQYIGYSTKLYASLLANNGKMPAFGIDLASKVLGHHSFVAALPYILLILIAIALQYLQMRQLNSRNPQAAQANPQAQMMQRYMPLIFAVIYINIAAAVNIYFIVSNLCRIGIQEAVFRMGLLNKPSKRASEDVLPRRKSFMEKMADAQKRALEQQELQKSGSAGVAQGAATRPGTGQKAPAGSRSAPGGSRARSAQTGAPSGTSTGRDEPAANGPVSAPTKDPTSSVRPKQAQSVNGGPSGGQSPNGAQPKRSDQSNSRAKRGKRGR